MRKINQSINQSIVQENKHTQLQKYQTFSQHDCNLDTACRVHHKFWDAMIMVVKPYPINFCICSYNIFHSKVQFPQNFALHLYQRIQKIKVNKEHVIQCKQDDWSLLIINECGG